MNISKEEVLSIISTQPNGNIEEFNFKKKFPQIYQEVLSLTFPENFKFTQKLYHYFHNDIELKLGLCPMCHKRCKFQNFNLGYSIYCSRKCASSDPKRQEKIKQTNLKKFGVECIFQSKEIKKTIKQTNLEKFGVENPSQSKEIKKKKKETTLKNWGVENPFQSEEIKKKIEETNYIKYGVKNPTQSKEIYEKQKQTNLEKFGVENPFQSEEIKKKIEETNYIKYGSKYPLQSEEIKQKQEETVLKKFGVRHPAQNKSVVRKMKNTCIERYGVDNFSKTSTFAKYHRKRIKYNNIYFDSSWEVKVYKFCLENNIPCEYQPNIQFIYEYNGELHSYQPDFLINGKIYEVKGDHFFEGDKMINPYDRDLDKLFNKKYQCIKDNDVIVLRGDDIRKIQRNINIFK